MTAASTTLPGFEVPLHRSLTEPVLLAGAPRSFTILNGTLAAAIGLGLVVLAETGRRPIDNPDTHLELTMVHEGPTLEYAGRDLALLHWASAARTWVVLVVCAEILVPHPGSFAVRVLWLAGWLAAFTVLLAVAEVVQPKMRLLRVPVLLYGGAIVGMLGLAGRLLGVAA